ncbi:MAG: T9SS type A sorting domain-containing protein [Bacteroidetes bacterium SB0662_bin_6]|nr:T9SS type A sorting domain-containing protein [Bacteroidetes bacterium SB0668_bin_1]MYE04432.1 T9SS type A sorting domain-containing protein [Bacteroidetes bacterium SB0662_bin_6]
MIKHLTACFSPALCFAVLMVVSPAFAQSSGRLEPMQPPVAEEDPLLSADDGMRVIHVTDRLDRMPEAVAAFQAYLEAKALGLLPVAKTAVSYEIGSEQEFNVLTDLSRDTPSWETLTFTLVDESDIANIWVANDQHQQGVASEEQLAQISAYVLTETPEGSWNSEKGLVENSNEIFGDPPDSPDADGKVDILLFDIEEGNDDCCVLGYVTSRDLDPNPDPGEGNAANILYVDLPQGLRGGVASLGGTIAHEYQHLIHYAYQSGPGSELTFINEGLSEWAELLNGFPPRRIRYLNDPEEIRVRLLTWRDRGTIRQVENDYQRSGLFTTYIADRIGPEATGSIVQAKCPSGVNYCPSGSWLNGVFGYDLILGENNLTTADIVADFHTTNFVNDAGVDAKYAYKSPFRQGLRAVSTVTVDTEVEPAPSGTTVNVSSGAVDYLTWESVTNLELEIRDFEDAGGGGEGGGGGTGARIAAGASNRSDLSLRLFTETEAGAKQLVDLDPETQEHTVAGEYARVTLIVVNTRASESFNAPSIKLDITGNWGGAAFDVTTVAYDTGANEDEVFLFADAEDIMAQLYDVPSSGSRLGAVFVAPIYDNQYTNRTAPLGAPRDFTLKVWNVGDDGLPGDELYSMDVDESPSGSPRIDRERTYSFLRVNLPADEEALSMLPERIFIGLANKGTDINYLSAVFARARSTVQDTLAYWYTTYTNRDGESVTGWSPVARFRTCRERDDNDNCVDWLSLAGQVFPIRARFLTPLGPVSTDDPVELPSAVRLAQNYPNPFNPSTSISWTQPVADRVRLSVYNLLGQNMATLVDGLRPAGEHEVRLDASGWASGVYVYVLETGKHTLTRHMVLLK